MIDDLAGSDLIDRFRVQLLLERAQTVLQLHLVLARADRQALLSDDRPVAVGVRVADEMNGHAGDAYTGLQCVAHGCAAVPERGQQGWIDIEQSATPCRDERMRQTARVPIEYDEFTAM